MKSKYWTAVLQIWDVQNNRTWNLFSPPLGLGHRTPVWRQRQHGTERASSSENIFPTLELSGIFQGTRYKCYIISANIRFVIKHFARFTVVTSDVTNVDLLLSLFSDWRKFISFHKHNFRACYFKNMAIKVTFQSRKSENPPWLGPGSAQSSRHSSLLLFPRKSYQIVLVLFHQCNCFNVLRM